jgi:ribosomal protein L7Ae-like RNA K-turn-binding protein/predicted RNA-binding protein YlxR (DUF448 family)
MVRLILGPDGEVAVDGGDGGFGRGAHVHPRPECLERAVRGGLARSAKGPVRTLVLGSEGKAQHAPLRVEALSASIRETMDRRIAGLLSAAVRSRHVTAGSDAVTGACERGEAKLLVVARDATAAADLTVVRRAVAAGDAIAWGTKERLGQLCGVRSRQAGTAERGRMTQLVGVLCVTSAPLAAALREAARIASGATDAGRGSHTDRGTARAAPVADRRGDGQPVKSNLERGA